MPASPLSTTPPPLTLIVAATHPDMGIGLRGALPWPTLRSEMAHFARVTRRADPPARNALIMGRRTWDSIPRHLRPLKSRLNVVVTRQSEVEGGKAGSEDGPLVVGSFADALAAVRERQPPSTAAPRTHRVFVIGGAQIYDAALASKEVGRILLTRIRKHFECDTFFPLKLGHSADSEGHQDEATECWRQRSPATAGEDVPLGVQCEKDVEWEMEVWDKMAIQSEPSLQ